MTLRKNPVTIKELIAALEDLVKYQGADFDDPLYLYQGPGAHSNYGDPPDSWVPLRIVEIGPTEDPHLYARSIRLFPS